MTTDRERFRNASIRKRFLDAADQWDTAIGFATDEWVRNDRFVQDGPESDVRVNSLFENLDGEAWARNESDAMLMGMVRKPVSKIPELLRYAVDSYDEELMYLLLPWVEATEED